MSFVLTTGSFSAIEEEFCRRFLEMIKSRKDPLAEQCLVLVPSSALRKHLLGLLYKAGTTSLSAVRIVSLNGLAQEILMDSLQEPYSALDDSIYFVLALQSAARKLGLKHFQSYRTAKGMLSTFRDLVDGLLTPDLLQQFIDQARGDVELQKQIGSPKRLNEIQTLYETYLEDLDSRSLVNVQYASSLALQFASEWMASRNFIAAHVYGFYDATSSQFELMELIVRQIHASDGEACMYFPFAVSSNTVEHPAEYAQEYFDAVYALVTKLGGRHEPTSGQDVFAGGGIESKLFSAADQRAMEGPHRIEITNAGSPYDESWVVAKKILQLVLDQGVRFDQIGVIARSMEVCEASLSKVFDENQIPHTMPGNAALCSSSAGQFAFALLLTRQSHMNHNLVFELMCSPLLSSPFAPAGIIRQLLEILFITNSDDWHRLKPLMDFGKKLPDLFELSEDDPLALQFRRAAEYLTRLKESIDQIPSTGRFVDFASALWKVIGELADPQRFQDAGGLELQLLLERLGDLNLQHLISLNEFVEIFSDYLANTVLEPESTTAESRVTVGDIMSLRGVSFDYVFIVGLNQDVWPLRTSEDPFLGDGARAAIRSTTGAGPNPKRGRDEEVLLFALALRSAKERLVLSYQRADADGRMKSASIYIESLRFFEVPVESFPRHLEKRLSQGFLPALQECSMLVRRYSPFEVVSDLFGLSSNFVQNAIRFAEKLNTMDRAEAAVIDGILEEPRDFWKTFSDGKLRFSFSRIKGFVRCGFSFYSDRILKLQPSPFAPTEIPHDLTALVKGRIAESVVKEALPKLRAGESGIDEAVQFAESRLRRKYSSYLPKVLLDDYLSQFSSAARVLLHYLQKQGYDFSLAEVPGRDYMPEMNLLNEQEGALDIYGIPDMLFYGAKKLIGEMKWGASATAGTADSMFHRGELQFCFYPELERQHRQLLETADFRYFRLNIFSELGSPDDLEQRFRDLHFPGDLKTTLRVYGLTPTQEEVSQNFEKLKETGKEILRGNFKILEDPSDYWSPCTTCNFILMCRRTHSATLLRAKKEIRMEIID